MPREHEHQPGWTAPMGPGEFDARAQRRRLVEAFEPRSRVWRLCGIAIAVVWAMAVGYFMFTPATYVSRWTLILPASNSVSSMTLESIGQASTTPSQPFGSVQVSPKVIYREIATSDQVRNRAAQGMGITPNQFGRVRVRLIDETSLMLFQISGSTAEQAQAKGLAIIAALDAQLDILRRDEYERRAAQVRESLRLYQANIDRTRERIIEFQRTTGLLSLQQFNEASSSAESLRRRLAEKRADLEKAVAEQRQLIARVGFAPHEAAVGLRLIADPAFARLVAAFAEGSATVHENALRFGPNHPAMAAARQKRDGSMAEITKLAHASGAATEGIDLARLVPLVSAAHQTETMRAIVAGEATRNGLRQEIDAMQADQRRLEAEVARMGGDAARLESLRKDHLAAEAVLTSAAARLDTNRADQFSSYPLVQVLSAPDLPDTRTQPRLSYALAAGILGTMLVLLAGVMTWVGVRFGRRRSRSG